MTDGTWNVLRLPPVQTLVSSQFLEDHLFVLQPVASGQHQLSPRVVHLALQVRLVCLGGMHERWLFCTGYTKTLPAEEEAVLCSSVPASPTRCLKA